MTDVVGLNVDELESGTKSTQGINSYDTSTDEYNSDSTDTVMQYDALGQSVVMIKLPKGSKDSETSIIDIDALNKKWNVAIMRLSRRDVYDLSRLVPQWDKIDPYLILRRLCHPLKI